MNHIIIIIGTHDCGIGPDGVERCTKSTERIIIGGGLAHHVDFGCVDDMPLMLEEPCFQPVSIGEKARIMQEVGIMAGRIGVAVEDLQFAFEHLRNQLEPLPIIKAEDLRAIFPEAPQKVKNPYAAHPRGFQGYMKRALRKRY
jgi:hypothetical protein